MWVFFQRKLTFWIATCTSLLLALGSFANTLFVDGNGTNPLPPFADWTTAATNIQDAIDASSAGDIILVTNGVYSTGGRSMDGVLTNRVSVNKAVTVQSVNGPFATIIQGNGPTNGANAVRCAWLTNNASLMGFTLRWGATRTSTAINGGGVFGSSSNLCTVASCLIVSNTAAVYGGGVYQVRLNNCVVTGNLSFPMGAVYLSSLRNSTVISNNNSGLVNSVATNCIIYYNSFNPQSSSLSYCCVTPLAPGVGNFTNAPQLFVDGVHLAFGSPCIAAGTNIAAGADIFGNAWANPPSIGCAEWQPAPLITSPQLTLNTDPVGFRINGVINAQPPFSCWWIKDGTVLQDDSHFTGTQTTNLVAYGVNLNDPGSYQLVASNGSGVVTSAVATVVAHYVDAFSTNAVAPYSTWGTAATNIQDAISAANRAEIVFVTNGVYATGGKSMDGVITNRVVVDKTIIVQSINGPTYTTIQGAQGPPVNGPLAIRCAWLTNNAVLSGFTLTGGATRTTQSLTTGSGGGVWASSNSACVFNCWLYTNSAAYVGGGAYQVKLLWCDLEGNYSAAYGGGMASAIVRQCLIKGNSAVMSGGASSGCSLTNCALIANSAANNGTASSSDKYLVNCTVVSNFSIGNPNLGQNDPAVFGTAPTLVNCIVYGNLSSRSTTSNYLNCNFINSDTTPLPGGPGNISADPQLLSDNIHLQFGSPCIGQGTNSVAFGTDIDGRPWANPPSIGCSESVPQPVVIPQLTVRAIAPGRLGVNVSAAGQPPLTYYWLQNGTVIYDDDFFSNTANTNLIINAANCAGTYQVVVSNRFGMATSGVVQIVGHCVDANNASPVPPYSSWATAATTIQDAIDASNPGDFVLVTNGLYVSGGRSADGILTNRVTVDKPLTVLSLNGYSATTIQGAWDPMPPVSTFTGGTGPLAVRCAWLTKGATLMGFTVQGGATRSSGSINAISGGGVFCSSSDSLVANCIVISNRASSYGGGVAYGTINTSFLENNLAYSGGGAYFATLKNCTIFNNYLTSSTSSSLAGSGIYDSVAYNCILTANYDSSGFTHNWNSDPSTQLAYCCTTPLPSGVGNINSATSGPVFLDLVHIAANCACRSAGSALYATGVDIDGEPWANQPSVGCDEVIDANLVGPLATTIFAWLGTNGVVSKALGFNGIVTGRASRISWSVDGGPIFTNGSWALFNAWTNPGTYNVSFTAYNADNPGGVTTNVTVVISPIYQPLLQSVLSTNNAPQFTFPMQNSVLYRILATTNLTPPVTWTTLSTLFGSGDVATFTDQSATNFPTRFYQVQAQ